MGCALQWRMVKCWCCFGGNWTWEEDWHWCLERLSAQDNSGRWIKKEKFSLQNGYICVWGRQIRFICWVNFLFFFEVSQTVLKQKLLGVGTREGSICSLPVMPSQLKAGRQTRQDQTLTQRGSAVSSLIITRQKLEILTPVQLHWVGGGPTQKIYILHMNGYKARYIV